ncbi:hypothetical protein SFRURICE_012151 [Spodoptera frugiperda]|nr:hypothetical protein SFRURICE_012151 [Spodoptera frugiperda]
MKFEKLNIIWHDQLLAARRQCPRYRKTSRYFGTLRARANEILLFCYCDKTKTNDTSTESRIVSSTADRLHITQMVETGCTLYSGITAVCAHLLTPLGKKA